MREWAELATNGIEALAVFIIVASIIFSSLRFALQLLRRATDPYRPYKKLLGRSLLVALELLVAADTCPYGAAESDAQKYRHARCIGRDPHFS